MRTLRPVLIAVLLASIAPGRAQNPMAIPPALDQDTFHLVVDEHVHQFYPGINTNTYGVGAPYLGPTLILHTGDTAHIQVQNNLAQVTNMHWHGLRVPGEFDGGPPREIAPGEHWDVKYQVKNPAGTYWYHPHPHELTAEQANLGVAGFILVQDDAEAALDLPRTYGVDDFPVVIQDRRFHPNGDLVFGPFGDSVLVNGTPDPYLECPAQVVRLRLLNGSNARVYALGFEHGEPINVIAGDGGMLPDPATTDRLLLSNGERAEVLLDLTGMEGDSLLLMSYGSELPATMPGSSYILWESSALSGIDFPVLRIRVTTPTPDPVTVIPATLVPVEPYEEADASRMRTKVLSGNGMVGMGMFYINGAMFDMAVVNDTVMLGATEVWTIRNNSNMAHPMHIHGGSFFILDRNGAVPPAWEQGAKDVALVDAGEEVRVIMRFEELSDGWPFMYHCHNLMHEDNMMMLQYIVVDPITGMGDGPGAEDVSVHPSPALETLHFHSGSPVDQAVILDALGRVIMRSALTHTTMGSLDIAQLPPGMYHLLLRSNDTFLRRAFMKG